MRRTLVPIGTAIVILVPAAAWFFGRGAPRLEPSHPPVASHTAAPSDRPAPPDGTAPSPRAGAAGSPNGAQQPSGTGTVASASPDERKRHRDRMHDDIRRALRSEMGDPAAPERPTETPKLDQEYLRSVFQSEFIPLAKSCYEALLASKPRLGGKAVLEFTIVGDAAIGGVLESVELGKESTLLDPEFAYCLRESLLSVTFAAPPRSGLATVVYPLDFSPD